MDIISWIIKCLKFSFICCLKIFPALNMNFVPKHEPTVFHTIYFCFFIFLLYLEILQSLPGSSSTYRAISNRFVAYKLPGSKLEHELVVRALTHLKGRRQGSVSSSSTDLSNCCQVLPSLGLCFSSLCFVFLVRFQIIFRWGIISHCVCGASSTELQC